MRKYKFTDFGRKVKIAVIERGETQDWLIQQVREKTGLYFDSSYLNKVMMGRNSNPKVISAIKDILSLECEC